MLKAAALILLTTSVLLSGPSHAQDVRFIGTATIDGKGSDKSGLPPTILEDGKSPLDGLNGFGSGMAYTGQGNRYVLLPDRGPNKVEYKGGEVVDFTTSYPNRFQTFDIAVTQDAGRPTGWRVDAQHVATSLLRDKAGEQFLGISTAARRFDPEGIRVAPDGTVWISDEYGPYILQFDQAGRQIGALDLPDGFLIAKTGPTGKAEMQVNTTGRVTNRGAEGLAITADGRFLAIAMQSPLIQDGGLKGLNTRMVIYDLQDRQAKPRQFIYPLADTKMAISEILAVDGTRLLVNERDGTPGATGRKLLYLVDTAQSPLPTDIAAAGFIGADGRRLPDIGQPDGIVALKKVLFADIGQLLNEAEKDGRHAYANARGLPDKIEGYAWGPDLPNGSHLLLACNDNDFDTIDSGFPNYIFAFEVPEKVLPGVTLNRLNDGVQFGP